MQWPKQEIYQRFSWFMFFGVSVESTEVALRSLTINHKIKET